MKPMLAATLPADAVDDLPFPLLVSPKLDGVRCLVVDGVAMSRNLKPIPNRYVQQVLGKKERGRPVFSGLDGELIVGDPMARDAFQQSMSGVMSVEGTPNVVFHVFDTFAEPALTFDLRLTMATRRADLAPGSRVKPVLHRLVHSGEELLEYEREYLALGYEGVMLRSPRGPYKHGRSTLREGWLLKLKRFEDSEAEVLGTIELLTNTNEAKLDELGRQKRGHAKAGLVPAGQLGALVVRDVKTLVEFELGTGFNEADRIALWKVRQSIVGRFVKYKFQPVGVKDRPRFPVFLGFRDKRDL